MSDALGGLSGPTLMLRILTPDQLVFEGSVRWVEVLLPDGLIGIWPGHAPLIASTASGPLEYDPGTGVVRLSLGDGLLRVSHGECVILVSAPPAVTGPSEPDALPDREGLVDELTDALRETLADQELEVEILQET